MKLFWCDFVIFDNLSNHFAPEEGFTNKVHYMHMVCERPEL